MIYLASPYSHKELPVREFRYRQALLYCKTQLQQGTSVFSPIVYGHQFATYFDFPYDAKSWESFNVKMLSAADEVEVFMLDGWANSVGIRAELELAQKLNKPITYVRWNK
jgi:hypothetical protein